MKAAAVLGLLLLATPVHGAAKSVTLLGVSGVGGEHFAELLEKDLAELYDLVLADLYRHTAERLDKRGASPEEVQAVATLLRIDVLIAGAITGNGRSRSLVVVVRQGATGRVVARGRYDLSGHTSTLIRERVEADLVRALDQIEPQGAKLLPAAVAESTVAPEEDEPRFEAEAVASVQRVSPTKKWKTSGIFAGVGISLLTRSLQFDVASAPGYNGGTVAGIRAEGTVFPLGLSRELAEEHPVLASFGFSGSYEHAFSFISSTSQGRSDGHASHWSVLFVGRIPLGHAARGGTLTLETGFQQLSWGSQSVADIGVPDVTYDSVDAGLAWEHSLGTRAIVFSLRAAYLGMVGAGAIASDSQYGAATGWGLEGNVNLTAWPTRWLWLRLDARYTPIVLSFAAAGTRFAHSAVDQWGGGFLEVGLAL